jgi:hypothetical protein
LHKVVASVRYWQILLQKSSMTVRSGLARACELAACHPLPN